MSENFVKQLVEGEDLSRDEMSALFGEMMDGGVSDIHKSALLVALRMKGETPEEIAGAAEAMRGRMNVLDIDRTNLVDTCGTGGDASGTVNISTVAAIVAAAAGARVAKHGNRAVSSKCGSADVLAALGVNVDLTPEQMQRVLERIGISFLFAPKLHPAMAAVVPVRKELRVRTIFNVLGPLTNPAQARRQVLGVFDAGLVPTIAQVLRDLGSEHAMVVHGKDGLDEISTCDSTLVAELRDGSITTYELTPEDLGVERASLEDLQGGDAETNAGIVREVLQGGNPAVADIVCVNAGAALYVAGIAGSVPEGITLARKAIEEGNARKKLEDLIRESNEAAS